MAVIVNFKICDNSKDCNGIRDCPTGAFCWDDEKITIFVDEEKCINCGKCQTCGAGAITVTYSEEETEEAKKKIAEDTRTLNDLFVDRYGASPIQETFISTEESIDNVLQSQRAVMIELYTEDTIECLINSIPIKEILTEFDKECTYRKVEAKTDKLISRYGIKELPALVFTSNGEVLGKIEGYYEDENRDELFSQVRKIIKKEE